MARFLVIFVVLAVVFWVVSLVDCAVQPATRHRGVSKGTWIVIVVLLPVVGGILWFVFGRTTARAQAEMIRARRAPDDDPEFLSSLGSVAEQDERIRRLEAELAALDSDGPDPRATAAEAEADANADAHTGGDDEFDVEQGEKRSNDDGDSRDQHGARS